MLTIYDQTTKEEYYISTFRFFKITKTEIIIQLTEKEQIHLKYDHPYSLGTTLFSQEESNSILSLYSEMRHKSDVWNLINN
jgi:hypothetical protein